MSTLKFKNGIGLQLRSEEVGGARAKFKHFQDARLDQSGGNAAQKLRHKTFKSKSLAQKSVLEINFMIKNRFTFRIRSRAQRIDL